MFPTSYRFNLRQDREFFQIAQRRSFSFFQLLTSPSESGPLFAVVVPKKVSPKSTDRHKLLRQMRSILMEKPEAFGQNKVVLVMFHSSVGKSFEQLREAVEKSSR